MARIRSIKPEFFTHPEVVACSIPARLLLISLLTQADDEGRLYDQPRKILGLAFGERDKVKIDSLLDELQKRGRIRRYDADDKACIEILNFSRHQSIAPTKFRPSTIPPADMTLPFVSEAAAKGLTRGSRKAAAKLTRVSSSRAGVGTGNLEPGSGTGNLEPEDLPLAPTSVDAAPQSNGQGRKPRARDEFWDTVVEVCAIDVDGLTDEARGRMNGQIGQLKQRGVIPEEFARRAGNSAVQPPTLDSVVKNWASLNVARQLVRDRDRPVRDEPPPPHLRNFDEETP